MLSSQYLAFDLTPESRTRILSRFRPKFEKIMCQHITIEFNLTEASFAVLRDELINQSLRIVGYQYGDGIECLVVEVAGSVRRPDGGIYHITLSLDKGHRPVESNSLLKLQGYQTCLVLPIDAELKLLNK